MIPTENAVSENSLQRQIECLKEEKSSLSRKLNDQVIITQKVELAFSTQEQLIKSKDDNIETLKIIASKGKSSPSCLCSTNKNVNDMTSNGNMETNDRCTDRLLQEISSRYSKPGFQESIICLNEIVLHG